MEQTSHDEGPAEPGSPLRAALDMLIVRGCIIEHIPPSDHQLEVYKCRYVSGSLARARMFYADARGAKQILAFLKELAEDDPIALKPTKLFVSADECANAMRVLNTTYGL